MLRNSDSLRVGESLAYRPGPLSPVLVVNTSPTPSPNAAPMDATLRADRDIIDTSILALIAFLAANWLFDIFCYWGSVESLPKSFLIIDAVRTVILSLLMVWAARARSLPATLVLLLAFLYFENHVVLDVASQGGNPGIVGNDMINPSWITKVALWTVKLLPLLFLYGSVQLIRAVMASIRIAKAKRS